MIWALAYLVCALLAVGVFAAYVPGKGPMTAEERTVVLLVAAVWPVSLVLVLGSVLVGLGAGLALRIRGGKR